MNPFIVKFITFEFTKLVDQDNNFHQSIKVYEALRKAREYGLDLVCFNRPSGNDLAFCKIIDYNKWLYTEEKKKKQQQKSFQKETKEIRLTPNIEQNDIEHKMRQVNDFLDDGHDVVLTMKMRGREKQHSGEAEQKMNNIVKISEGHGKEVSRKKNEGLIIVRLSKV